MAGAFLAPCKTRPFSSCIFAKNIVVFLRTLHTHYFIRQDYRVLHTRSSIPSSCLGVIAVSESARLKCSGMLYLVVIAVTDAAQVEAKKVPLFQM